MSLVIELKWRSSVQEMRKIFFIRKKKRSSFKWPWKDFSRYSPISILFQLFIGFGILSGCSKTNFEKSPTPARCSSDAGTCNIDETIFVSGGMVDVLFVNDNSGSMSFEQSKMAERFPNLLQKLDERFLDYRIGITTTDISSINNPPRAINQNGALQNGRLISFNSGLKFLEPNTNNKFNLFLSTMKRPETLECENYINTAIASGLKQTDAAYQQGYYEHCPSGDERGIVAANRVIRDNADQFIRPEAHLALVIISDENERTWGSKDSDNPYVLGTEDLPSNLINTVKIKYPNKTFSAHSVIVKTYDQTCLRAQDAQMNGLVKGQYGGIYEELSNSTNGIIGSVCAADYGDQMGQIGAAIVKQVEFFTLHCENPENLQLTFIPLSAETGYHLEGRKVVFDRDLDPAAKVRFQYTCPLLD